MNKAERVNLRQSQPLTGARHSAYVSAQLHSKRVRRLKIAIPALALGAVMLLVGFSFFNPFRNVPKGFSAAGYGLDGTRVTMEQPRLSGYHKDGQPYQLKAKAAQQDIRKQNIIDLTEMEGTMGSAEGGSTHVGSTTATYDSEKQTMIMRDNVQIRSNSGYDLRMNEAVVDFRQNTLISKDRVTMQLKNGTVLADSLNVSDGGKLVSFEGHVQSTFNGETAATTPKEGNAQ